MWRITIILLKRRLTLAYMSYVHISAHVADIKPKAIARVKLKEHTINLRMFNIFSSTRVLKVALNKEAYMKFISRYVFIINIYTKPYYELVTWTTSHHCILLTNVIYVFMI